MTCLFYELLHIYNLHSSAILFNMQQKQSCRWTRAHTITHFCNRLTGPWNRDRYRLLVVLTTQTLVIKASIFSHFLCASDVDMTAYFVFNHFYQSNRIYKTIQVCLYQNSSPWMMFLLKKIKNKMGYLLEKLKTYDLAKF